MNDTEPLDSLINNAEDSFAQAMTPADLENAKALFLGKSGRVTELMKGMAALSVEEKKSRGAAVNLAKQAIEVALSARRQALAMLSLKNSSKPKRWTSACLVGNAAWAACTQSHSR